MALVVTGHRVCVRTSGRQAGGSVGVRAHQEAFLGWVRLNHAALGGFMALDYPGAVGLGHAALLHWRSLSEGQRSPGAVQPGAL